MGWGGLLLRPSPLQACSLPRQGVGPSGSGGRGSPRKGTEGGKRARLEPSWWNSLPLDVGRVF